MITLRQPGDEPAKNPETDEELLEEMLEALATPLSPTGEALDEGRSVFVKGEYFTEVSHGILFQPDPLESRTLRRPHPLSMAETRPITVFEGGWQMPTDQVWEPLHPLVYHPVSQTFPMSAINLRRFMKILGDYRLPGDKPLIHKGKKP